MSSGWAQKGFKVIPAKDTLRLLKNQQISQLNLATARSIARQAGANYAVYGSFSKTGDAFSIDARMVDAAGQQGAQPYFAQKQNMIELLPAVDELVDKMGGGAVKGDAHHGHPDPRRQGARPRRGADAPVHPQG